MSAAQRSHRPIRTRSVTDYPPANQEEAEEQIKAFEAEQARIRDEQAAKRDPSMTPVKAEPVAEPEPVVAEEPEVVTAEAPAEAVQDAREPIDIHFVADGLTVNGKTMYRGDELYLEPGSSAYEQIVENPRKWWTYDKWQQTARWGEQKFDQGPWQGGEYDLDDENLTEADRAALRAALERRLARHGGNGPGVTNAANRNRSGKIQVTSTGSRMTAREAREAKMKANARG